MWAIFSINLRFYGNWSKRMLKENEEENQKQNGKKTSYVHRKKICSLEVYHGDDSSITSTSRQKNESQQAAVKPNRYRHWKSHVVEPFSLSVPLVCTHCCYIRAVCRRAWVRFQPFSILSDLLSHREKVLLLKRDTTTCFRRNQKDLFVTRKITWLSASMSFHSNQEYQSGNRTKRYTRALRFTLT